MSSLATGRSANRGLCAQPCRLPHDLVDEEGNVVEAPGNTRPLCPKDYCTVDHLQEMIDAGVGSLQVEGRMKAPDYVYNVVGRLPQRPSTPRWPDASLTPRRTWPSTAASSAPSTATSPTPTSWAPLATR